MQASSSVKMHYILKSYNPILCFDYQMIDHIMKLLKGIVHVLQSTRNTNIMYSIYRLHRKY